MAAPGPMTDCGAFVNTIGCCILQQNNQQEEKTKYYICLLQIKGQQAVFRLVADTETELVPTYTDVRSHNYSS
jgi:hypothetical protein